MSIATTYTTGDRRPEMVPFLPANIGRVLEIGCGEGAFAYNYANALERWGVELSASDSEKARPFFDRLLNGTYSQVAAELPDGYFDLVVCNDVIEHMEDHDAFLRSIRTKLRDGGRLVGSVPNVRYLRVLYEFLVKKDWRYKGNGTLDHSHLRFFTRKSLLRVLREHGLVVRKFHGINRAGKPWWALHKSLPVALVLLLTLGYYRDALYVQYGFSVEKPPA